MTSTRARVLGLLLLGVVTLPSGVTAQAVKAATDDGAPAGWRGAGSIPIAARHRYRMAAKIRPLLLFWIGRDDVGGAQVVWRRSPDGAVGFELLIGSDPARAPRRVNRWGYIAEEVRGSEARLLGVMKQSNEQSLDEAKAKLAAEGQSGQYVFKAIRAVATAGEASSRTTTIHVTRDLTFHDVATLLELVERESANGKLRQVPLPGGTRPGFLVALSELIQRSIEITGQLPRNARALPYIFNGSLCDLTLVNSERVREAKVGTHAYSDVIRTKFEARNRVTGKATEFELLYGASGPLAGVPVHAVYQPRWWFQVELFLADTD
ncbi:MAG: hypothetical protein HY654_02450 [Acidobacteria bacterium]|nr:hypothetical protein [Acidobacteriota bacterium]